MRAERGDDGAITGAVVTTITVKRTLTPEGDDVVTTNYEPADANLIELVGLLGFAADAILRDRDPGDAVDL